MRHGPRRLWYAPWSERRCSCPDCVIERTINAPATAEQLYDAGLALAREMQRERGRWWVRGAR